MPMPDYLETLSRFGLEKLKTGGTFMQMPMEILPSPGIAT
jgi:hypothetical protein